MDSSKTFLYLSLDQSAQHTCRRTEILIQSKSMTRSQKSRYREGALKALHKTADCAPNRLMGHERSPMLLDNVENAEGHRILVIL